MADDIDDFRLRADRLLSRAAGAANMAERGRLIDEAMRWHVLASGAGDPRAARTNDDAAAAAADEEPAR